MIGVWRGNDLSKKLLVICLMLFALVECIETFMLHVRFNPIKLSEYDTYIYGPMLLIWAFVTWLVLRNRPKKADIHSS